MKLMSQPSQPNHHPALSQKLGNPKYEIWKSFLPRGTPFIDMA
jgi:hypothetical protein